MAATPGSPNSEDCPLLREDVTAHPLLLNRPVFKNRKGLKYLGFGHCMSNHEPQVGNDHGC